MRTLRSESSAMKVEAKCERRQFRPGDPTRVAAIGQNRLFSTRHCERPSTRYACDTVASRLEQRRTPGGDSRPHFARSNEPERDPHPGPRSVCICAWIYHDSIRHFRIPTLLPGATERRLGNARCFCEETMGQGHGHQRWRFRQLSLLSYAWLWVALASQVQTGALCCEG